MEIVISSTKEEKELTLIDPKTGCEWTGDFINNGDINVDNDNNATMSAENYDWWMPVVEAYQAADNAVYELSKGLEDPNTFLVAVSDAQACDLEDQPAAMMVVVEEFKKKLL